MNDISHTLGLMRSELRDVRSVVNRVDHKTARLAAVNSPAIRDGSLIIRMAASQLIARAEKRTPIAVAAQLWGDDFQLRAAVAPAQTTVVTWAAELLATVTAEIPDRLLPASVFGQLRAQGLALSYSGDSIPRVPLIAPVASGGWIGEGQPISVGSLVIAASTLAAKKCASIVAVTRELLRGAPGNVEASLQAILSEDLLLMVDATLLDATAADAIRPAGLRNGVAGLTPTAAGTPTEKAAADVKVLLAALGASLRPVLIGNAAQIVSLRSLLPGATALPAIVAPYLASGMLIVVDAAAFASITGAVDFLASEEAVIHASDAALPIGTPGSPNVVAAPSSSLFQTASFGLRTVADINWTLRRAGAVSWMSGVTW
ncbi:phage major capsid protein [Bradyrhizobium barranii subsp. apii]|uniref:phage major capsid protein n=1 Tax=Bradyrhizobium barranii TaxID=2992140 RepID=UPI001AA0C983|nr:phage major capsid protein [Bradyrhizobium barranii]UPT98882.1 phage major capsid protein [Bradyrhizobium barranii subsp. apii]